MVALLLLLIGSLDIVDLVDVEEPFDASND